MDVDGGEIASDVPCDGGRGNDGVVCGQAVCLSNDVMEAYWQAMDEIAQENIEDRRDDADNFGDGDSVFDADDVFEDVNIGDFPTDESDASEEDEIVPAECVGDESDGGESYGDESAGGECYGDESDYGVCDETSESGNTGQDEMEQKTGTDNETTHSEDEGEDFIKISDESDFVKIDMFNLNNEVVSKLQFGSLEVAYKFYCWYAKLNGFAVRKGQVIKNKGGDVLQQTFVCNREGFRKGSGLTAETRTRGPKNETRCGCNARFRVHVDVVSRIWYITVFGFVHNHDMLKDKHCCLLAPHRKLTQSDKIQVKNYGQAGIKVTQMIGAFANAAGGYDKVGFVKKDLHNQVQRQRKESSSDAKAAVKYLMGLRSKDPLMFVAHTVDAESRLQNLFWCDGESQKNYEVFGDVLAFDATYKKNKYKCPFVVFSGVNHHNQTIIFATAVVCNEVEGTYVWLLEQFLLAMKGKMPISVITDGDLAMRNAIKRVFPNSYHRLCAWHLLRNAMSNIGNADFIPYFKRCMLGDHEVWKFEKLWDEMIDRFGLQDNRWIKELYRKRNMWATAHIRGHFFAGIRTTSRCEAFHSHMGQFVHSKMNMTEFVKQFHRCVCYFRFREVEADFQSQYGKPVLQTTLRLLERSASQVFTKEIFMLVRTVLKKVSLISLVDTQNMTFSTIYSVNKYRAEGHVARVCHTPSTAEFKCTCLRMESIGIPCEHIVAILVYLDIAEFPSTLVLNRWSQFAKESIRGHDNDGSHYWDAHLVSRHANLVYLGKELSDLAYKDVDDYKKYLAYLTDEICRLKSKYGDENDGGNINGHPSEDENILNPATSMCKHGGATSNVSGLKRKHGKSCGVCSQTGHNKRSCPHKPPVAEGPVCSSLQSMSGRLSNNSYIHGYVNSR